MRTGCEENCTEVRSARWIVRRIVRRIVIRIVIRIARRSVRRSVRPMGEDRLGWFQVGPPVQPPIPHPHFDQFYQLSHLNTICVLGSI